MFLFQFGSFFKYCESTPFAYQNPDVIKHKKVVFKVTDYPDLSIFTISDEEDLNCLLAIGDYENGFYYPEYSRDYNWEDYCQNIYAALHKIREKTENSNLILFDFKEKWAK